MENKIIIAIDGPSSSGKSTLARDAAKALGYTYIDTGAMYRAVTLFAIRKGLISGDGKIDADRLVASLDGMCIEFRSVGNDDKREKHIFLNDEDVEGEIRRMEVASHVSAIAALPAVRRDLQRRQQALGKGKGVVMDGRDIGTVVFPDAELKIFLTAPVEERARRRLEEMKAKGDAATWEDILNNVISRDKLDSSRTDSPLRMASDAVLLDNSGLTREEQLDVLLNYYNDCRDR
jgi:cytidylate kinase